MMPVSMALTAYYYWWYSPNSGDYYSGTVYDDGSYGYYVGENYNGQYSNTESGYSDGYYHIYESADATKSGHNAGEVTTNSYYDTSIGSTLTSYFQSSSTVGYFGLGSEYNFAWNGSCYEIYGGDYYEVNNDASGARDNAKQIISPNQTSQNPIASIIYYESEQPITETPGTTPTTSRQLIETFDASNDTDKSYEIGLADENILDPDYVSSDLPASWGRESGLVSVGSEVGAAFLMKRYSSESQTGFFFTGSYKITTDGLRDDDAITLAVSKPTDWSGPLAAWRLYVTKEHGQLEIVAVFGKNTVLNNSSGHVISLPIMINQVYDVAILYDTIDRVYAWAVNGQLLASGEMPTDWPLIGTQIIGSSGSSVGRNTQYLVDNVAWRELPGPTGTQTTQPTGFDFQNIDATGSAMKSSNISISSSINPDAMGSDGSVLAMDLAVNKTWNDDGDIGGDGGNSF